MTMISALLQVSEAYREARRLSLSRTSSLVFGDGKVLPELAEAKRDITTKRLETALMWFSTNWPDGAVWPKGVARPKPSDPSAQPNPEPMEPAA